MKEKAKESESERAPRTERSTNEGENKRDSEEERAWWGKSGKGAEWGKGSQLRTGAKRLGGRVRTGVQGGRHRMECRRGAWAVGLEAAGVDGGSDGHGEPASLVTIATSTGRVLHQQPRLCPWGHGKNSAITLTPSG